VPGGIEVTERDRGLGGFVLHFAHHVANAAITERVPGSGEFDRKFKYLFRRVLIGYQHAVKATEGIAEYYLWPKFESHR
jgi:hypothetical protein